MNLIRAIAILFLIGISPASANQREPAPPPQDPSVATIRGDVVSGFFGTSGTRIAAINGKIVRGPEESCARLDLEPGSHSIVIATHHILVPLRLDAVAGAAYVVSEPEEDVLLIENENSGETVFRSFREGQGQLPLYVPSIADGSNTAKIRIAQTFAVNVFGFEVQRGTNYLHTVDGKPLPGKSEVAVIEAGTRAISLYIFDLARGYDFSANPAIVTPGGGLGWWQVFPLLLDIEAGHEYLIERGRVRVGNFDAHTTLRILDETSGKEIMPALSIAFNVVDRHTYYAGLSYNTKVSFPDAKGQMKRPPPKPKQWCEHD